MALLTPLYMQNETATMQYTAAADRAGLLSTIFSREGVLDVVAGQLLVTQRAAGANFTVDIAAGRAAIYGDDVSDQGAYICTSTTVASRTIPAAPASGTRYHRIVAQVRDRIANSVWTQLDWEIVVLPDTGSGLPAIPNSAIPLAQVAVAAGAVSILNAAITDQRPSASVGTADRTGTFSLTNANWAQTDAGRPFTYRVNPDGWVSLAGWANRAGPTFLAAANAQYDENPTSRVPLPMRPKTNRDFLGLTSVGPVHWLITPAGAVLMRFRDATNLPQNGCWISFDGCGYRVSN